MNKTVLISLSSGQIANSTQTTVTTFPSVGFGIYKSTDQGSSWRRVLAPPTGDASARATDLAIDPNDSAKYFAAFQRHGVFRSIDRGETWTPFNDGIDSTVLATAQWVTLTVAKTASTTTVAYAMFSTCPHPASQGALIGCVPKSYRSIGGGAWTSFGPPQENAVAFTELYTKPLTSYGMYTHHLAVDPIEPNRMIWSGVNLWTTINSGADWFATFGDGVHPDWHQTIFPHVPGRIEGYGVSDGGFSLISSPIADRFQRGLTVMQFQSLAARPRSLSGPTAFDDSVLIGGTQDNGTVKFVGPEVWDHIDDGDASSTLIDLDDARVLYDVYVGLADSGVRIDRTGGIAGSSFDDQPFPSALASPTAWYPPVIQDPNIDPAAIDGQHPLFTGTDRVYRSYDRGKSWNPVGGATGGETTTFFSDINSTNVITSIAAAKSDVNRLYIGYYDGQIFKSADARSSSASWSRVYRASATGEATPGVVTGIAVSPVDANNVYATITNGSRTIVIGSTTGGTSWTDLTGELDATPINAIMIEPLPPHRLIIGRDDGVWQRPSSLGTATWKTVGRGLPSSPVYAITHDGSNLYVATHGRGVWKLGDPLIKIWVDYCKACVDVSPILPSLPNPPTVNGFLDIPVFAYALPRDKNCHLALFQGDRRCAHGNVDGLGHRLRTNALGQLTTTTSAGQVQDHAWACFDGRCAGDDAYSACLTAPVTEMKVACGGTEVRLPVAAPIDMASPPATPVSLDIPKVGAVQGLLAVDVALRDKNGDERPLCSTTIGISPGESSNDVLEDIRDRLNGDPICVQQSVTASLKGELESEDAPSARRLLVQTTQSGTQVVTRLRARVANVGIGFEGASDGARGALVIPTLQVIVPTDDNGGVIGAAGGSLSVTVSTFEGPCTTTVPVHPGDNARQIAKRLAASLIAPGSACPTLALPEVAYVDLSPNASTLSLRGGRGVFVRTSDPSLTLTLGVRSRFVQQVPPQTPPPSMNIFSTPLAKKLDAPLKTIRLKPGDELALWAHESGAAKGPRLLGAEVLWSATDPSILDLDRDGHARAKALGKTTVTAAWATTSIALPVEITP